MTIHLITFSDSRMSRSAELCIQSAKQHGVDQTWHDTYEELKRTSFFQGALYNPRGCGFWSWKPLIILDTMLNAPEWDMKYLIYADAGVEFLNSVNYIIDRMDQDIFLFGNQYEHAHWCKRDIVEEVLRKSGYSWPREPPWEMFGKQVQASVIFFRVSDHTRAFVKEWLDWCLFEGGRLIDDSPSRAPNHPEFQENRHDQAILTTMAYRDGIKLHYWPANYNDGAFEYPRGDYPDEGYPILVHHHRRRNVDWEQVA